jgi:hypothetical protein
LEPFQPDFWTTIELFRDDYTGRTIALKLGLGRSRRGQLLFGYNTGNGWLLPGGKEDRVRSRILGFFERWTIRFDAEPGEVYAFEPGVAHFLKGDYGPFVDRLWDWETLRQIDAEGTWYDRLAGPPEDLDDVDNIAELMVFLLGYAHDVYSSDPSEEDEYDLQLDMLETAALGG